MKNLDNAVRQVLSLLGNVDHSTGNGANAAKMRGDMLNSVREILTEGLRPDDPPEEVMNATDAGMHYFTFRAGRDNHDSECAFVVCAPTEQWARARLVEESRSWVVNHRGLSTAAAARIATDLIKAATPGHGYEVDHFGLETVLAFKVANP